MNWQVPLFEPDFGPAELEAVQVPVREGWLTMGRFTARLEEALCKRTGAAHACAVTNGTAALHLSLVACGIGLADEVLCPTLTFVATVNAIRYVGATPIFCESISPNNLNIDPDDIRAKLSPRTRAILVVHYAGYPVDLASISAIAKERNLVLIEDCAHALFSRLHGRVCGTWGHCGCFSFFSNKNLTCGEGGAVVTNNASIATKLRRLRSHGMTSMTLDRHQGHAYSYDVLDLGYNYRIDELRSNLLLVQLQRLNGFLERRQRHVASYSSGLQDTMVTVPHFDWHRLSEPGDYVGHHLMPVLLPAHVDRRRVMDALRQRGVQSSIHYPPVHQFSSFRNQASSVTLPRTEALASRELTLPLYPSMTETQIDHVCQSLKDAIESS
jgi:dTDP-4-amino-4,6-dideoxygalactose transaminase